MSYFPFGAATFYLGSSIGSTDSSILLSSFTEPVTGTPYTMALINSTIVYATIAPKTSQSEFISFTGITQNSDGTATLTGVTRGLAKKYPFTSNAAYQLPHAGQSTFIISDAPQVFEAFSALANDETITGLKTFPGGGNAKAPVSGTVYSAPTNDLEYASKKYVDGVAVAGAPNASTTVKGIVQEATQAQIFSKTQAGSTGADLYVNPSTMASTLLYDYVVDTGVADNYAIAPTPTVTALTVGQVFIFKATNTNTTASTLAVNGLTPKLIKKNNTVNLLAGDIQANAIVIVVYDGTSMQMISQNGHDPATTFQTLANLDTTSTLGTSDTLYPSQHAVKTYVDNKFPLLGTWGSGTADGAAHQATTDGFLVGYATNSGGNALDVIVYTDSNNPPTTVRMNVHNPTTTAGSVLGWTVPVKKNDYYKISAAGGTTVTNSYFIPLGN